VCACGYEEGVVAVERVSRSQGLTAADTPLYTDTTKTSPLASGLYNSYHAAPHSTLGGAVPQHNNAASLLLLQLRFTTHRPCDGKQQSASAHART